ncbi:MAG TPA: plastocyanin/azurin family copper-binding protein [Gemmatimonadales bacterium]|nr:plastocyanin/azurin family copper-binding protein [Gemmatimonadales bacterium]
MRRMSLTLVSISLLVLAACGERPQAERDGERDAERGAESAPDESHAPAEREGDIIEVKLITDEQGNRFEPAQLEAETGDLIRLVLVSGVHNMHFLPDSNPGKTDLPPASEMLQLPGQTLDIPVTMGPGSYYFQCDPHAALGMVGRLEVEE